MANTTSGGGYFAAFRRLLATLTSSGRTRLELLGNELQEEKFRLLDLLSQAIGALFLAGLAVVLIILTLVGAFWEQRVAILGISAAVAMLGALWLSGRARQAASRPSHVFASSLAELDKDIAALRGQPREE